MVPIRARTFDNQIWIAYPPLRKQQSAKYCQSGKSCFEASDFEGTTQRAAIYSDSFVTVREERE